MTGVRYAPERHAAAGQVVAELEAREKGILERVRTRLDGPDRAVRLASDLGLARSEVIRWEGMGQREQEKLDKLRKAYPELVARAAEFDVPSPAPTQTDHPLALQLRHQRARSSPRQKRSIRSFPHDDVASSCIVASPPGGFRERER